MKGGRPTDDVLMLLAGIGVAASLGWLIGRLARDTWPRGLPLGEESREAFWQKTLPWPTGVQEDSEIAWHVPRDDSPLPPSVAFSSPPGPPAPPTRPQPRVTSR